MGYSNGHRSVNEWVESEQFRERAKALNQVQGVLPVKKQIFLIHQQVGLDLQERIAPSGPAQSWKKSTNHSVTYTMPYDTSSNEAYTNGMRLDPALGSSNFTKFFSQDGPF